MFSLQPLKKYHCVHTSSTLLNNSIQIRFNCEICWFSETKGLISFVQTQLLKFSPVLGDNRKQIFLWKNNCIELHILDFRKPRDLAFIVAGQWPILCYRWKPVRRSMCRFPFKDEISIEVHKYQRELIHAFESRSQQYLLSVR